MGTQEQQCLLTTGSPLDIGLVSDPTAVYGFLFRIGNIKIVFRLQNIRTNVKSGFGLSFEFVAEPSLSVLIFNSSLVEKKGVERNTAMSTFSHQMQYLDIFPWKEDRTGWRIMCLTLK